MDLYGRLARPLLFRIPPEAAHNLAHVGLRLPLFWKLAQPLLDYRSPRLSVSPDGLTFPNPVGLAAGWDKDCKSISALRRLGFGYIVGGTVTPEPRPGNPKPRLLRDPQRWAAINSMGFPNEGVGRMTQRLRRLQKGKGQAPLYISIAANDIPGFCQCLEAVQPLVDGIEVNISSPNTRGLRMFHDPRTFERLLVDVARRRLKPLLVKLPPYFSPEERESIFELVRLCLFYGITGVTVSNTHPMKEPRLAVGVGGLSGKPLLQNTLQMVGEVRSLVGNALIIHASGGIFDGEDALAALQRGADTVQVMSALWYSGPRVAYHINRYLDAYLKRHGVASLAHLRQETWSRNGLQTSVPASSTAPAEVESAESRPLP